MGAARWDDLGSFPCLPFGVSCREPHPPPARYCVRGRLLLVGVAACGSSGGSDASSDDTAETTVADSGDSGSTDDTRADAPDEGGSGRHAAAVTLADGEAGAADKTITFTEDGGFDPGNLDIGVGELFTVKQGGDGINAVKFGDSTDTYTITGGLIESFTIDAAGTYTMTDDLTGETATITVSYVPPGARRAGADGTLARQAPPVQPRWNVVQAPPRPSGLGPGHRVFSPRPGSGGGAEHRLERCRDDVGVGADAPAGGALAVLGLDVGDRRGIRPGAHRVLVVVDDVDLDAERGDARHERRDRAVALARHRHRLAVHQQVHGDLGGPSASVLSSVERRT